MKSLALTILALTYLQISAYVILKSGYMICLSAINLILCKWEMNIVLIEMASFIHLVPKLDLLIQQQPKR